MENLKEYAIVGLEQEIAKRQAEVQAGQAELRRLSELLKGLRNGDGPKRRKFSVRTRRRMAAAQRERWRKWRAQQRTH